MKRILTCALLLGSSFALADERRVVGCQGLSIPVEGENGKFVLEESDPSFNLDVMARGEGYIGILDGRVGQSSVEFPMDQTELTGEWLKWVLEGDSEIEAFLDPQTRGQIDEMVLYQSDEREDDRSMLVVLYAKKKVLAKLYNKGWLIGRCTK